ncbi:MAG: hypothetical protein IT449_16315 [Phycisphaerales bacterium]|nr:hypothetical protein [Phycisphaerales bacterium]
MTRRGTIRGKTIELLQPVPFADGQEVTVSITPDEEDPPFGSPQALLKAIHEPPHLDPADVDELDRAIEAGKLPVRYEGVFDQDQDS